MSLDAPSLHTSDFRQHPRSLSLLGHLRITNGLGKCHLRMPRLEPDELSSLLEEFYPPVLTLDETIPFTRAKLLSISIKEKSLAIVEVGLDTPNVRRRLQGAVTLAVDTIIRRVQTSEPLPRTALID